MFRKEMLKQLEQKILPFWKGMADTEHGGYYGFMDEGLHLNQQADKGCILNSRILWTFSEAARIMKDDKLREYAEQAYRFLDRFTDLDNGGVYWSVTYDGNPADTTKHTYCQAFAVYGLAAYSRLTDDPEALKKAIAIHHVIEKKCRDQGGYLEALKKDFSPESNEKLSENGVMASRTMNTLLHVIEAYAELYRVWPDAQLKAAGIAALKQCLNKIYDPEKRRLEVFFDTDFHPLLDMQSYGHDIEASWLIRDAAETLLDEAERKPWEDMCFDLLQSVTERAFTDHGLHYEIVDGELNTNRAWWPQAEAVLGFLSGWQVTRGNEWLERMKTQWRYITQVFIDPRDGSEWFNELLEDGTSIGKPMVDEWKCPYHNGRMCLKLIEAELPAGG